MAQQRRTIAALLVLFACSMLTGCVSDYKMVWTYSGGQSFVQRSTPSFPLPSFHANAALPYLSTTGFSTDPKRRDCYSRDDVIRNCLNKNPECVNCKGNHGTTPLHMAVMWGRIRTAKLLISRGADVNARDDNGRTPLGYAAYQGCKNMIELLISEGADVNSKDMWGSTSLHLAVQQDHKEIPELVTSSDWMACCRRKAVVELLISKGADVNSVDNWGSTTLHRAVQHGHMDIAELLIAKGAEINIKTTETGQTPLDWAFYYARNDIAGLLISKGADINTKEKSGCTPLYRAVEEGQPE